MKRGIRSLSIVFLFLSTCGATACFEPLTIEIIGDSEPTFILHDGASGSLGYLIVREYSSNQSGPSVWSIGGKGNYLSMSYLHPTKIHFSEVPSGWVQETPSPGVKPTPLVEGKTYQVICGMFDVESRAAIFRIQNGKAVEVR